MSGPGPSVEVVAADLVGLHSSDPATVYLSARARVRDFRVEALEEALYEARDLVRILGMRRTMFVLPRTLAPVIEAACSRAFAPAERKRLAGYLESQGIADDGRAWIEDVSGRVLTALRNRGEATAVELTEDVPELGLKLTFGEGKSWGGTFGMSTRVLVLLASEARIVRARPLGTWVSSQYRWAPMDTWLGEQTEKCDPRQARADLLTRWLWAYGPATIEDAKWWTGWPLRDVRQALGDIAVTEVRLTEGSGFVLPDDVDVAEGGESWVALLPSLDSTIMGWKGRSWYLPTQSAGLFDRNGNAGPTVWVDGRVVGAWSQRADGRVATVLVEPVGSRAKERIREETRRLEAWLGEARLRPRFSTPLEKSLRA